MIEEWQIISAKDSQPQWTGDLSDDCTARWAGFLLRAEWIDDDDWWWAVFDANSDEVAGSHAAGRFAKSGAEARMEGEKAVRRLLGLSQSE